MVVQWVYLSRRGGMDGAFHGLAGLLRGISWGAAQGRLTYPIQNTSPFLGLLVRAKDVPHEGKGQSVDAKKIGRKDKGIHTRYGRTSQLLDRISPMGWVGEKIYIWHMTCDMWHVTRDMWHVRDGGVNIISNFRLPSSYGLGVKGLRRHCQSFIVSNYLGT